MVHKLNKLALALSIITLLSASVKLGIDAGHSKFREGYIAGAFEAVKYRQSTGHDASWAWIVTAASYCRPSGQSDEDWIRITDARAAAWEAEHIRQR